MSSWGSYGFQDSLSYTTTLGQEFHDYTLLVLIAILSAILIALVDLGVSGVSMAGFTDLTWLEVWWTILPGVILLGIAFPSLRLLYLSDEIEEPSVTINVLGHQWYWEYSTPSSSGSYDSYMKSGVWGQSSLLAVESSVVAPCEALTRVLVSASDVIHSWALPGLGVKVDGVPGRLNQIGISPVRSGVVSGQCSEICGANHSFMPIVVEVVPLAIWASMTS